MKSNNITADRDKISANIGSLWRELSDLFNVCIKAILSKYRKYTDSIKIWRDERLKVEKCS